MKYTSLRRLRRRYFVKIGKLAFLLRESVASSLHPFPPVYENVIMI
jgi:hypothetical protein